MKNKRRQIRVVKLCKKCHNFIDNGPFGTGWVCTVANPYCSSIRNADKIVELQRTKFKNRELPEECPYKFEHAILSKQNKKNCV